MRPSASASSVHASQRRWIRSLSAGKVRAQLGVPDSHTAAPVDALDHLGAPLRRRLEALGDDLVRHHNPFVRHVIKRRRHDLRNPDGTPVFREVPVNLHGEMMTTPW